MYRKFALIVFVLLIATVSRAQNKIADSTAVVKTFKELVSECKNIDFNDPKTLSVGFFYKAAKYIIYRGDDKTRSWKDFANYSNEEEKKGVNSVCERINGSVNQDSSYKIVKYFTEKESEGTWHILMISYLKKGKEKKAAFAFLKIKNRFGLGDID